MIARHQIRSKDILWAHPIDGATVQPWPHRSGAYQFWQALTCYECFAMLEHLANMAIAGADDNDLKIAVQRYLTHCPDCQGYYDERIEALEYWLEKR
jgi:hypothetical protein